MRTIVLIDSGNTRLKVGAIDGEHLGSNNEILVQALDNDDYQSLRDWLAGLSSTPVAALGTNVAGAERAAAIEASLSRIGCPIQWIVPQAQAYGLTSRYTRPEQLGADRWVSMLGVVARLDTVSGTAGATVSSTTGRYAARLPFLLATFGTATTLDTVSGDRIFEGGLIMPGPELMRRSLASGTANLPLVQGDATAFPTDTQHAITSGVAAAQAGAVLRQWLAGRQRYDEAPEIHVTGGGWQEVETETRRLLADATSAMGCLPPTITVVDNPVLYGLARIAAATNLGSS